jgi:putative addiction module CopG family antidote
MGGRNMEISLSTHFDHYVRAKVASGEYANPTEVIEAALHRMELANGPQGYTREEINALIEEGERDFDNGDYVEFTHEELERIKAEGRSILNTRPVAQR